MKKLFALVLALAMLIPMALTPVAKAEEFTKEPFYVLNWSAVDNTKFPHIDDLLTTNLTYIGENARFNYGGVSLLYGSYTDDELTEMATVMKKEMDKRPEGMRYWTIFGIAQFMRIHAENVLFFDTAIVQLKAITTDILKRYKEIGGKLDGMVLDIEYEGLACWYIQTDNDKQDNNAVKNPLVYKEMVSDPRYAEQIRPMLVERGFIFHKNVTDYTPEIYTIHRNAGSPTSRSIWDAVMRIHLNRYANEWCYEPLKEYYPEASLSDYQSYDSYGWSKGVALTDDGQVVSGGGNTIRVGNVSCTSYYSVAPDNDFLRNYEKYTTYNEAILEHAPFSCFMHYINLTRRMYEATDTKMVAPWLVDYWYGGGNLADCARTPYYTEQTYHLGMFDPEPFLDWMYTGNYTTEEYEKYLQIIEEQMVELDRVAGYSDREPIAMPENWNNEFMLSGMYAGGRNIWRITPNTFHLTKEEFLVDGTTDPTFYIQGQTITFPGGKIIEDATISVAGSCGYWVETPKDVMPIVKNDADRYVKIPAFGENFESYTADTKLTAMTTRDAGTWAISAKGNDLMVKLDGSNKVLAITGNSSMKNILMPQNVTAADSYAKNQSWKVTVTIPAGMTADEAITLLNYEANIVQPEDAEEDLEDGGFKVSGGKVYYCENGQYKEMSLDVSKGGKYTFRRIVDIKKDTCDYIVLDSTGKEAASNKAVSILNFTGKVTGISIGCKGVKGSVLLDNYNIRAEGAFADFTVYEAFSGVMRDKSKAQSVSAGYRLSWVNINDGTKTATIMADITENGTTTSNFIKELTMPQGCDGVETGIVEITEGQTVKVYLKTDIANVGDGSDEEEAPEATDPTEPDATEPDATTPTVAPTTPSATKAPTLATRPRPTSIVLTRPTEAPEEIPTEPDATEAPEEYPTEPEETDPPVWIPTLPEDPTEAPEATEAPDATDAPESTDATAPQIPVEIVDGSTMEALPETLIDAGIDSVEALQALLTQHIQNADTSILPENIAHYDVFAAETDIPEDGKITVVLPYPAGTDATYKFVVVHMVTSDAYGMSAGDVELPEVTNTEEGIYVELTGLSPISIGWSEPEADTPEAEEPEATEPTAAPTEPEATEAPEETEESKATKETKPKKDDEEEDADEGPNVILIVAIAAGVVLIGGGAAAYFLVIKKKLAKK